jgi:ABC-2 type transport system ATP-binding protein
MHALAGAGVSVEVQDYELLEVKGLDPRRIARTALDNHVMVYELTPLQASLEEAYMELTKDEVEYHSLITTGAPVPAQSGGHQS